ncbi:MAG: TatD family hydrolase [Alphaproteobacteria bacterium]|nr:TatD family hydrolase [Alphaproteobacteria bacterium]
MFIDTHCHLDYLSPDYVEAAMENARAAGVKFILNPSTRDADSPVKAGSFASVLEMCDQFPEVYGAVGIHPSDSDGKVVSAERLIEWAQKSPKIIAIGETGLEYHYEGYDKAVQKAMFIEHVAAARELGLPLIVHSRDADEDMEKLLVSEMKRGEFSFTMHCYASGRRLADAALEIGGYISASGIITYKSATALREIFAAARVERLLTETDAPFLAPVPHRGEQNEPAFVAHVARELARLRGMDESELCEQITKNTTKLFKVMI